MRVLLLFALFCFCVARVSNFSRSLTVVDFTWKILLSDMRNSNFKLFASNISFCWTCNCKRAKKPFWLMLDIKMQLQKSPKLVMFTQTCNTECSFLKCKVQYVKVKYTFQPLNSPLVNLFAFANKRLLYVALGLLSWYIVLHIAWLKQFDFRWFDASLIPLKFAKRKHIFTTIPTIV